LTSGLCDTDEDILKLKASLWALGHFGSTTEGLRYLLLNNCLTSMIALAQDCLVLSIRATSYYALGLISTTRLGADELFKLGGTNRRCFSLATFTIHLFRVVLHEAQPTRRLAHHRGRSVG
jgi:hypothetical protein